MVTNFPEAAAIAGGDSILESVEVSAGTQDSQQEIVGSGGSVSQV